MLLSHLKRFTVRISQCIRRASSLLGNRLAGSRRLNSWFYPNIDIESITGEDRPEIDQTAEEYRHFNEHYFADVHEQERMLADKQRMAFYHEAISRHIKQGDRVIDLGTGTGILAAFASRQGAKQVYAVDHSSIIDHAMVLAAENGIENVDFEEVHSTEFYLDDKVDVILHEQIGDYLFDERMVPNICDLRDRLLKPDGIILPSQFELYCEPMTLHDDRRVPYMWELSDVHGFDFSSMKASPPENPDYYRLVSCDLSLVKHFLGHPVPLVEVDLHTVTNNSLPLSVSFNRTVIKPGSIDGLVIYMKAKVDEDLVLSSSPIDPERASHWGYRILRLDQSYAEVGDQLNITLTVKDWPDTDSWEWTCEKVN